MPLGFCFSNRNFDTEIGLVFLAPNTEILNLCGLPWGSYTHWAHCIFPQLKVTAAISVSLHALSPLPHLNTTPPAGIVLCSQKGFAGEVLWPCHVASVHSSSMCKANQAAPLLLNLSLTFQQDSQRENGEHGARSPLGHTLVRHTSCLGQESRPLLHFYSVKNSFLP